MTSVAAAAAMLAGNSRAKNNSSQCDIPTTPFSLSQGPSTQMSQTLR